MASRSILQRPDADPSHVQRSAEATVAERGTQRPDSGARVFGRMKRAIRKAERRAGDGTEIGGTGATILKVLAAPLVRLGEEERIGTAAVRAAEQIAVGCHTQACGRVLGA